MVKKAPDVGDEVRLTFLDHSENGPGVMLFDVYGKIIEKTRKAYKVGCWVYHDAVDKAGDDNKDNETTFWVVKSTIESIKVFR